MSASMRDRVRGVLLGLAAGDRIGGPTAMACQLGRSLLDCKAFDPVDARRRYLGWWNDEGFDTGPVADEVFRLIQLGTAATEAPARVHAYHDRLTAGCNPAHRTPPLAMAGFIADAELAQAARAEAAITHFDRLAGDVAATGVGLCRKLIRGASWSEAVDAAAASAPTSVREALLDWKRRPTDRGGYAPVVLHAAIHFAGSAAGFEDALGQAIDFAGGANYCPVLCGAIGGARWGAASVAGARLEHHRTRNVLEATAAALAATWQE